MRIQCASRAEKTPNSTVFKRLLALRGLSPPTTLTISGAELHTEVIGWPPATGPDQPLAPHRIRDGFKMNIHEYQAKAVLKEFGVPVPRGLPAFSVEDAVRAAQELGGPVWWVTRVMPSIR